MSDAELQTQLDDLRAKNAALQEQLNTQQESKPYTPTEQVCKIAIKLPPFWADRPAVWFAQAEAQFHLAGINNDITKFSHIVSMIDQQLVGEIEDIVMNPPETNKYQILKEELIRRLSSSEQQRVERLLSAEELGDKKPSAFLRRLRSLAGQSKDEGILRQLWMRRLPNQVQAILAAQADLSTDKLAELADKIIEVTPGPQRVYSLNKESDELSCLKECITQLTSQIAALTASQQRGRSRTRSASSSKSRSGTPEPKLCWYHKKFGAKATRCTTPCSWKENSNSNQ